MGLYVMDLFELSELKNDLEYDINYYKKEKQRLEIRLDVGATKFDKDKISGSVGVSREDVLLELTQISIYLDSAIKKLDNIKNLVNDKYNNYKVHNNYDKQIYTEKKLFKWSNDKISARHHGVSKSQIYRIVEKIEKNN